MGNLLPADGDVPYVPPKFKKEEIAEEFITWAVKYWGLNDAYKALDSAKDANTESAPWSYIQGAFIRKLNEMIENIEEDTDKTAEDFEGEPDCNPEK
jgi:hypothetical protein